MSSGSLISSLFRDNSFASRSSSMFQKSFSSIDNDNNKNRSQSALRQKIANITGNNKYLPVNRMVHLLAVKIKKLNYFLFCRLEANLKKYRSQNPPPQLKSVQSQIIECSKITQSSKITTHTKSDDHQDRILKGLDNICQILELNQLKQSSKKITQSFKKLKKFGKKKDATHKLIKNLFTKYRNNMNEAFKSLQKFQKFILRSQIFTQACSHVILPKLKDKMKIIRQFAIQRKIQLQIEERQKQRQIQLNKKSKIQKTQHSSAQSSENINRLKSIQQQNSILSEQQTARFITPQKGHFRQDLYSKKESGSKTQRKQTRYPPLTRKQTRKHYQFDQTKQDYQQYYLISNIKKNNEQDTQQKVKMIGYKLSTKKQPYKPKIILGKSYKIQTILQDNKIIKIPKIIKKQQYQQMTKLNRFYPQSTAQPLPDLHDNMGVFQQVWFSQVNYYQDDGILSHRTIQNEKYQNIENQKIIGLYKQKTIQQFSKTDIIKTQFQKQQYQSKMLQSFTIKQNNQYPTNITNSRSISNCKSSPKFVVETGINTSNNYITNSLTNLNDQFYSSPLFKIQEMMLDLQKLRQKQKYNNKYTTGYQKCKISVNLPSRKNSICGGKSYQGSANKINNNNNNNHSGIGKNIQCKSDKKQFKKDSLTKMLYKENNQPKQNIQVKLWDQKDKFLFYTDSKSKFNKDRKRSSCIITSMNQSQINTARKMKKQIQGIINSRKNRTSLGNLKIVKTKY